jgi:hypothetical protein
MSNAFFEIDDTMIYEVTKDGEVITHDLLNDLQWGSLFSHRDYEDLIISFGMSWTRLNKQTRGWIDDEAQPNINDSNGNDDSGIHEPEQSS